MRLGIDLGGTKISAAVLDGAGEVVHRARVPTPLGDYAAMLGALSGLVADAERRLGTGVSVGVGIPGSLDPATGEVRNANAVALNDRPLGDDLAAGLRRPVRVANDADCFALSEAADGAAAGARVVFGAILGTGAGGGIVVDGALLGGPNAITGEWGHIPMPWARPDEVPGPACYCGRFGCVEMFIAGPGIERSYRDADGRSPDQSALRTDEAGAAVIVQRAADGDETARRVVARHADQVARALAVVLNILDPDVVVLGGGLSNLGHLYSDVPDLWDRYVFTTTVRTRLVPAVHGDDSGVLGAARLWPDPPGAG